MPPHGDSEGHTLSEKGVARYLGVYYIFCGTDGDRWHHQRGVVEASVRSFFAKMNLLKPTMRQYRELIHNVLLNRVLFVWRVMPPSDAEMAGLRQQVARRAAAVLHLGALGTTGVEGADVEALLAPYRGTVTVLPSSSGPTSSPRSSSTLTPWVY